MRTVVAAAVIAAGAACADANPVMPVYRATEQHDGTLRIFGSGLKGLVAAWAEGYMKYQKDIRFGLNPGGSDAAIGALQHGTADIGVFGRELTLNDYLGFGENHGYDPTQITIASGGFDVPGSSFGLVVFVSKDNPLTQLTMQQLDGIFGAPRSGGYHGFRFVPQQRTAKDNIRTWGQLGLTGEWKNREIQTYGYADGGMRQFFEYEVFDGGDKWNENYRQYVENGTRIIEKSAAGEATGITRMLEEIEKNKFGIGYAGLPQWKVASHVKGIKPIALAAQPGGPYYAPTKENMTQRLYPLTRSVYIQLNQDPTRPLLPRVKDFMEYVLSEEGQEIVRKHGIYLPLPADVVVAQRAKLR